MPFGFVPCFVKLCLYFVCHWNNELVNKVLRVRLKRHKLSFAIFLVFFFFTISLSIKTLNFKWSTSTTTHQVNTYLLGVSLIDCFIYISTTTMHWSMWLLQVPIMKFGRLVYWIEGKEVSTSTSHKFRAWMCYKAIFCFSENW